MLSGCVSSGSGGVRSNYANYAKWANNLHKQDTRYKFFVNAISKSSLKTLAAGSTISYADAEKQACDGLKTVSYTHLTLPTILLV